MKVYDKLANSNITLRTSQIDYDNFFLKNGINFHLIKIQISCYEILIWCNIDKRSHKKIQSLHQDNLANRSLNWITVTSQLENVYNFFI